MPNFSFSATAKNCCLLQQTLNEKGSEKLRTQTRPRNATRHVTWYLFTKSTQNITKGLILGRLLFLDQFITWKLTHFIQQKIHFYQPELVKSCSLVKIKIPYSATFPLRFSHPDPLITQNPAPALNWNSRFPLPFSALIPNIATKISQIPHPAKPIVDAHCTHI